MERFENLADLKRKYPNRRSTFAVLYNCWKSFNSDITLKMRKIESEMRCNPTKKYGMQAKYDRLAEKRTETALQMFRMEKMYHIAPFYI